MNVYSNNFQLTKFGRGGTILRARGSEPLSLETIASATPAVFAEERHESRSQKYTFISTKETLEAMLNAGFHISEVRQGGSKDETKKGYTKHMIRFRKPEHSGPKGQYYSHGISEFGPNAKRGDTIPEVCLVNSHDGTSRYQVYSGLFRITCLNGLIVAVEAMDDPRFSIPHKGNVLGQVVDAAFTVIDHAKQQGGLIEHMQAVDLTRREQVAFAEAAKVLRWDDEGQRAPITPPRLLETRRVADQGTDLWRTFNVVQENVIKGGQTFEREQAVRNDQGQVVARKTVQAHTRPIQGISDDVKLNKALWVLAQKMAELKS